MKTIPDCIPQEWVDQYTRSGTVLGVLMAVQRQEGDHIGPYSFHSRKHEITIEVTTVTGSDRLCIEVFRHGGSTFVIPTDPGKLQAAYSAGLHAYRLFEAKEIVHSLLTTGACPLGSTPSRPHFPPMSTNGHLTKEGPSHDQSYTVPRANPRQNPS